MTALLVLALAVAPGCPAARADAGALAPEVLAARAPAIVARLDAEGAGGRVTALERAAGALGSPEARSDPARSAAAFRGALATHCALAAAAPLPGASAADRAALAEVLARPELSRARSDPYALRRALVALWQRLLELLGTAEAERYASLGRALFVAVALGSAAFALSALRRRRSSGAGNAATLGDRRRTPTEAADASAALAEEALRAGDGRAAVRLAFLAALGALERAGRVPRGRALTNAEMLVAVGATATPGPFALSVAPPQAARSRRAPATPTLADDLTALAHTFDRAIYGGHPVAPEDALAAVERARRIDAAAAGPR